MADNPHPDSFVNNFDVPVVGYRNTAAEMDHMRDIHQRAFNDGSFHASEDEMLRFYNQMGGEAVSDQTREEMLGVGAGVADYIAEESLSNEPFQVSEPIPEGAQVGTQKDTETVSTSETSKAPEGAPQKDQQDARAPTEIEATLSSIRVSPKRASKLVFAGNEELRNEFFQVLRERGKLHERGGNITITMGIKAQFELYKEIAERRGMEVAQLVDMKVSRGEGLLAQLKNNLGFDHRIRIFAGGTSAEVQAKRDEVQRLVSDMKSNGLLDDMPRENSTIKAEHVLAASATLSRLVSMAQDVVIRHNAALNAERANNKATARGADGAKAATKEASSGVAKSDRSIEEARLLTSSDEAVKTRKPDGQMKGKFFLRDLAKATDLRLNGDVLRDPESRQEHLVRSAVLIQKGVAGAFDNKKDRVPVELHQKLSSLLQKALEDERASDPEFPRKSAALIKQLEDAKVLSPKESKELQAVIEGRQAETFIARITESTKDVTKEETVPSDERTQSAAPKEAVQSTSVSTSAASGSAERVSPKDGAKTPEVENNSTVKDADKSTTQDAQRPATPDAEAATTGNLGSTQAASSESPSAAVAGASSTTSSSPNSSLVETALSPTASSSQDAGLTPEKASEALPTREGAASDLANTVRMLSGADAKPLDAKSANQLLVQLEAFQGKDAASLENGDLEKSKSTLMKLDTLVERLERGEQGAAVAQYARIMRDFVEDLKEQAGVRQVKSQQANRELFQVEQTREQAALSQAQDKAVQEVYRDAASTQAAQSAQVHKEGAEAARANDQQKAQAHDAQVRQSEARQVAPEGEASAQNAARAQQDFVHRGMTQESANGFVSKMSRPANFLITRSKTWNLAAISQAAKTINRLDPATVRQVVSAGNRLALARYAQWFARNAANGRLPGLDQQQVQQLQAQARQFEQDAPKDLQTPVALEKNMERLEGITARMQTLELERSSTMAKDASVSARVSAISSRMNDKTNLHNFARDAVHAAYQSASTSKEAIQGLLRGANRLTPEALEGLPKAEQAKTIVALHTMARQALNGDFGQLSPGAEKDAQAALQKTAQLTEHVKADPQMPAELLKARNELAARSADGASESLAQGADKMQTSTGKGASQSTGRDLDR